MSTELYNVFNAVLGHEHVENPDRHNDCKYGLTHYFFRVKVYKDSSEYYGDITVLNKKSGRYFYEMKIRSNPSIGLENNLVSERADASYNRMLSHYKSVGNDKKEKNLVKKF